MDLKKIYQKTRRSLGGDTLLQGAGSFGRKFAPVCQTCATQDD